MPNQNNDPLVSQLLADIRGLSSSVHNTEINMAEIKGTIAGFTATVQALDGKLTRLEGKADKGEKAFDKMFEEGGIHDEHRVNTNWRKDMQAKMALILYFISPAALASLAIALYNLINKVPVP